MQHDASEQPHKQMQNKNHWKKTKNGGGKGKSLKIGGDWKPESLSTLMDSRQGQHSEKFDFDNLMTWSTSLRGEKVMQG